MRAGRKLANERSLLRIDLVAVVGQCEVVLVQRLCIPIDRLERTELVVELEEPSPREYARAEPVEELALLT